MGVGLDDLKSSIATSVILWSCNLPGNWRRDMQSQKGVYPVLLLRMDGAEYWVWEEFLSGAFFFFFPSPLSLEEAHMTSLE